jgi:hypothetical protein
MRGHPWVHFVWSWPTYHQMLLYARNKNIHVYGLRVGISVLFEIWKHFCLKGTGPPFTVMTCIPSCATWHKKQDYIWLRGGDLNGFWDMWTLSLDMGDGISMYSHDIHTITGKLKQEYIEFRGGDLNCFRDIWALSVSRGTGPLHMVMT